MDKQEFLKLCYCCGYAKKEIAEKYAKSHDELTEQDLINVYRIAHGEKIGSGLTPTATGNGKTTKSYYDHLSDK